MKHLTRLTGLRSVELAHTFGRAVADIDTEAPLVARARRFFASRIGCLLVVTLLHTVSCNPVRKCLRVPIKKPPF